MSQYTAFIKEKNVELITSLLNNPALASIANTQVFVAVLLALLIYRLLAPIVDFLNPFIILLRIVDSVKRALAKSTNSVGTECYGASSRGNALKTRG